jgi:hypothetical protein
MKVRVSMGTESCDLIVWSGIFYFKDACNASECLNWYYTSMQLVTVWLLLVVVPYTIRSVMLRMETCYLQGSIHCDFSEPPYIKKLSNYLYCHLILL